MAFIMIVSWLFVMAPTLSWWRTRLKLDLTFYCKFHVPGPVIVFLLPSFPIHAFETFPFELRRWTLLIMRNIRMPLESIRIT